MNALKIATRVEQTAFRPGDEIVGAAGWELATDPDWLEIRLFWFTEGKGTQDVAVVETQRHERPGLQGAQPFRFVAPEFPHSFSGRLISLQWALELVVHDLDESARQVLVISPTGKELELGHGEGAR